MTKPPALEVVPLAAHVEAERREARSKVLEAAEMALEKAKRGELVGLVFAYQYASDRNGGGVGCHIGVAPGSNAATLIGELEVAKSILLDRYLKPGGLVVK